MAAKDVGVLGEIGLALSRAGEAEEPTPLRRLRGEVASLRRTPRTPSAQQAGIQRLIVALDEAIEYLVGKYQEGEPECRR
jgi:hypothetical protein